MTPNKEDYLKCIYEIGTHTQKLQIKKLPPKCRYLPQLLQK